MPADRRVDVAEPMVPTTDELRRRGLALGLSAVGVADAEVGEPARSVLHLRKASGLDGGMQFTYRNPDRSTDPRRRMPGATAIVVGALRYASEASDPAASERPVPVGVGAAQMPTPITIAGRLGRYVWQDHYARLEEMLRELAEPLVEAGYRAQVLLDSNHLVDRQVAWRAGIGWYGKNTNLLLPDTGSWFVLGSILTDAPLEPATQPLADGCGSCRRCLDDCPTQAIVAPGVVDAGSCIAWLVQARDPIPAHFRAAVGDRLYGCDDCQEVCPPNRARPTSVGDAEPRGDLEWILTADDAQLLDRHGRWYIADRDPNVIRRTALVVLGNTAEPSWGRTVIDLIRRHLRNESTLVRHHAVWAARRLGIDVDLPRCCAAASGAPGASCPDPELHRELTEPVDARFDSAEWGRS